MTRAELLKIAKPILFNSDMIRAILDGRKTVTRRVVKREKVDAVLSSDARNENPDIPDEHFIKYLVNTPYHKGNIIYVRETWCNANREGAEPDYYYYADTYMCEDYDRTEWKWRPSIHMPRKAARIFLKVTDVRVERLQKMTASESAREGIRLSREYDTKERAYILKFADLWDSTIKKSDLDCYGWDANPWVWVIEFERIYPDD